MMKQYMKKNLTILFFSLLMLSPLTRVFAEANVILNQANVKLDQSTVSLDNPISSNSIPALIGRVITAVLGVVGSIALLMVIYGGFTWMLAAGSSEKIKKGRDIIVWAMLGLVVIFTSYALVRFVITSI